MTTCTESSLVSTPLPKHRGNNFTGTRPKNVLPGRGRPTLRVWRKRTRSTHWRKTLLRTVRPPSLCRLRRLPRRRDHVGARLPPPPLSSSLSLVRPPTTCRRLRRPAWEVAWPLPALSPEGLPEQRQLKLLNGLQHGLELSSRSTLRRWTCMAIAPAVCAGDRFGLRSNSILGESPTYSP